MVVKVSYYVKFLNRKKPTAQTTTATTTKHTHKMYRHVFGAFVSKIGYANNSQSNRQKEYRFMKCLIILDLYS